MTRHVRRVPADWEHPHDGFYSDGTIRYLALRDGPSFAAHAARWDADAAQWNNGEFPADTNKTQQSLTFEEWEGPRPDPNDYMPLWADNERTHYMMFETSTEGTPVSPPFETPEALAQWMVANNKDVWAGQKLTYDEWLEICSGAATVLPSVTKKTPLD